MCFQFYKKLVTSALVLTIGLALSASTNALQYEPNELVLKLEEGNTIEAINEQFGTGVSQHLPQLDIYLLDCFTPLGLDSLSTLIEALPEVIFCHPNYLIDPLQPVQGSLPITDLSGEGDYYGQAAVDLLNLDAAQVFKTLVAHLEPSKLVVAVIPVSVQLNLKKLAAVAGAKRAMMAEISKAEGVTGYVAGGISPLGQRKRLPTFIDSSAFSHEKIFISGGRRGLDISLKPQDLAKLLDATVAEITG